MNRLVRDLLYAVYVVMATILVLEAFFRIFPQASYAGGRPLIGFVRKPAYSSYEYNPDFGYEKPDVREAIRAAAKKGKNGTRILIIGDSVSDRNTGGLYVSRLEESLADRYGGSVSVVNAGTAGYDTGMEYGYLKEVGLEAKPDMVILQMNPNDFAGSGIIFKDVGGAFVAYDSGNGEADWINPFLFAHSMTYRFLAIEAMSYSASGREFPSVVAGAATGAISFLDESAIASRAALNRAGCLVMRQSLAAIHALLKAPIFVDDGSPSYFTAPLACEIPDSSGEEAPAQSYDPRDSVWKVDPGLVELPLAGMKTLLEGNNTTFVVFYFPYLSDNPAPRDTLHAEIVSIIGRLGLEESFVDMTPYFSNQTASSMAVDTTHPNDAGHEIIASVLFRRLTPYLDARSGNDTAAG